MSGVSSGVEHWRGKFLYIVSGVHSLSIRRFDCKDIKTKTVVKPWSTRVNRCSSILLKLLCNYFRPKEYSTFVKLDTVKQRKKLQQSTSLSVALFLRINGLDFDIRAQF